MNNGHILVVDDDPTIAKIVSANLRARNFMVTIAEDGISALKAVADNPPDLVILDLMMPNETGTGFYRKLSRNKELGDTPVIVVSALAGRELAVKKPVAVFDKPINPDKFIAAVEKALE